MADQTEQEMRDSDAPTHGTTEELKAYIDGLVNRGHDYGTCVYAMSLAATAAFNFVASKLGVTGFQASCADLDILKRTRRMKHGFMILDANDVLYPQYDLVRKAAEFVERQRKELAPEAKKLLAKSPDAHPNVRARWEEIAAQDE